MSNYKAKYSVPGVSLHQVLFSMHQSAEIDYLSVSKKINLRERNALEWRKMT